MTPCACGILISPGLTDQSICTVLEDHHTVRAAAIQLNSTDDRDRNPTVAAPCEAGR